MNKPKISLNTVLYEFHGFSPMNTTEWITYRKDIKIILNIDSNIVHEVTDITFGMTLMKLIGSKYGATYTVCFMGDFNSLIHNPRRMEDIISGLIGKVNNRAAIVLN